MPSFTAGNGTISSNGLNGTGDGSGGGSGGSVNITCTTLSGSGNILANGGTASSTTNSGGGGGRIAISLTSGTSFGSVAIQAFGGNVSGAVGAAGTVYLKKSTDATASGQLIIDNNSVTSNMSTLFNGNWVSDTTVGDVMIQHNANLKFGDPVPPTTPAAVTMTVNGNWTNSATQTLSKGTVTFAATSAKTINSNNQAFYNLTCNGSGGTWSLAGAQTVSNDLTVTNGTLQTVKDASGNLTVTGTLLVDTNGTLVVRRSSTTGNGAGQTVTAETLTINGNINADGQGFDAGAGPGTGPWGGGACHGGEGTNAYSSSTSHTYGSMTNPTSLGSGGNNGSSNGGAGGGAIIISSAGTVTINSTGVLSSAGIGNNVAGSGDTSGAAGSINITAGTLTGTGTIRANGGNEPTGSNWGQNGGGGRISLNGVTTDTFTGTLQANGGIGNGKKGYAGTIYLNSTKRSNLTIGGSGNLASLRLGTEDTNDYTFGTITINSGGLLEVDGNPNRNGVGQGFGSGAVLNVTTLTVNSGGHLSADGMGFTFSDGFGWGSYGQGGSYGGESGGSFGSNDTYGSANNPQNMGSPGCGGSAWGGGALIFKVSGTLTVNGNITANGLQAPAGADGISGGSGGTVNITAATLTGSATISANGAGIVSGTGNNSGGGGGRVAISLTSGTTFGSGAIQAFGGVLTSNNGAAGTVYLKKSSDAANAGKLTIDNNGNSSAGTTLHNGTWTSDFNVGDVLIQNGANFKFGNPVPPTTPIDPVMTVLGNWTDTATQTISKGTITFAATSSKTISDGGQSYYNLVFNGSGGSWSWGTTETVSNNLTLTAGTLTAPSGTLNVAGNFTHSGGTYSANGGTLKFNGTAAQTLDAGSSTTFSTVQTANTGGVITFANNGFTATTLTVAASNSLKFQSHATYTLTNITLSGTAGNLVTLRATEEFNFWLLNVSSGGTQTISYVDVQSSDASSGATINATNNCTNSGLNTNWDFGTAPVFQYATSQTGNLTHVYCRFDQAMDSTTATNTANWSLSGGLTVSSASISGDKKLVTLTASGNVTLGTTTVTASSSIKSLVLRNLATTTLTIGSGSTDGIPAATAATVTLSTDGLGQSTVFNGPSFNFIGIPVSGGEVLTITLPPGNTTPTTINVGPVNESGGTSQFYLGTSGTATTATLTTSGGTPNSATVNVRFNTQGTFQNDISLRAYDASANELGLDFMTAVTATLTPALTCYSPAPQAQGGRVATIFSTAPAIPNLNVTTTTYVVTINTASLTQSFGTIPSFTTGTDGTSPVAFPPYGTNVYDCTLFSPTQNATYDSSTYIDINPPRIDNCQCQGGTDTGPAQGTSDDKSICPNCNSKDSGYTSGLTCLLFNSTQLAGAGAGAASNPNVGGGCCGGNTAPSGPVTYSSVDPADGEKKLGITDLRIPGRGLDYLFHRSYRSYSGRKHIVNHKDFGENWTYTYADEFLVKDGTGADNASNYINFRDGNFGCVFVNTGVGTWGISMFAQFVQMTINSTGTIEIRDESGFVREFNNFSTGTTPNANGRLISMRDRNGNKLTFHYDQIDPDGTSTNNKYVLSWINDTMGREVRYQYYATTAQTVSGRVVTIVTSNTGAYGRLAQVVDWKDNMTFSGSPTQTQDFSGQFRNRTLVFDYDSEGNLVRATSPLVAATPNGNDFSSGKTSRYKYVLTSDLSTLVSGYGSMTTDQQAVVQDIMLHKVLEIWHPNEVQITPGTNPADSLAADVLTYNTTFSFTPSTSAFVTQGTLPGFVATYTIGGTNGNNVPSGGTITYTYTNLNPTLGAPAGQSADPTAMTNTPTIQVDVTNCNGNQARYIYGGAGTLLSYYVYPRGFRSGEPANYLMTYTENQDRILTSKTYPLGNSVAYTINSSSPDHFEQSNLIREIQTPDSTRGGDQSTIEHVWVYEPIYQKPSMFIQARGSNMTGNDFTPPLSDPASRTMIDPYDNTRTLNMRYATVNYFDYQESMMKASAGSSVPNRNKSGHVDSSPLIAYDSNVLATEVLLVQELGLPEDSSGSGLVTLRARLSANLISLGLGDLNGDGNTDPVVNGNVIRTIVASPVLVENLNQNSLESTISSSDLIDHGKTYAQGGPNEGSSAARLQTTVTMYQYNSLGQLTKIITPEGNLSTNTYYAENSPSGNSVTTPTPADGRTMNSSTGGYLQQTAVDTTRSYYQQTTGTLLSGGFSNNNTNPTITNITSSHVYDNVGNMKQMTNPRGIRTDFFINELNQVVQTKRAADISGASADPLYGASVGPLTAFAYLSQRYFDYNNNVVLSEVEDRGNTSGVAGRGFSASSQDTSTTPGLSSADGGSTAFVDTLMEYDRLDDLIETQTEINNSTVLMTQFRYDSNQNRVLTIYPAGNADGAVFDERDLLFQSIRSVSTRPSAGNYAAGDPTTFNRPGGSGTTASTYTSNYDKNRNPIESVNAISNGGNTSSISGAGDVTALSYDGYDRRKTMTDALGNVTTFVYDPDSNVVRTIQNGDPVDDTHGSSNIGKTLAVMERIFDERSRVICSHKVLFQTPVASPQRTPTLTNNSTVAGLAPYLSDASSNNASVPGASGITVIGRMVSLFEYDKQSRKTFEVHDDIDCRAFAYDGASRTIKTNDGVINNGFSGSSFTPANVDGNLVEMAYDGNSNAIERKETDKTTVSSVANETFHTTSFYDSLDRLQTTVSNIGQAEDYRYDSRNNLVAMGDAVGPVNTRSFNRRGLGSSSSVTVNDLGNVSRTRYDGQSRTLETESILTSSHQGDGTHTTRCAIAPDPRCPVPVSIRTAGKWTIPTTIWSASSPGLITGRPMPLAPMPISASGGWRRSRTRTTRASPTSARSVETTRTPASTHCGALLIIAGNRSLLRRLETELGWWSSATRTRRRIPPTTVPITSS